MGVNPLRVYIFKDGLVRLAAKQYPYKVLDGNMARLDMHLCRGDREELAEGERPKRCTFRQVLAALTAQFGKGRIDLLEDQIDEIIIKVCGLLPPQVKTQIKHLHSDSIENNMNFQIFAFDFMLDTKLVPYLLDMQDMPSFVTQDMVDTGMKREVIMGPIKLLALTKEKRIAARKKLEERRYQQLIKATKQIMVDKVAHIDPSFKEALLKEHSSEGAHPMPGDEYRRLKMLYKHTMDKERRDIRRNAFYEREKEEAAMTDTGYRLIYPLLTYKQEYFIEDQYPVEEAALQKEINTLRARREREAEEQEKKFRFDLDEVYISNVKEVCKNKEFNHAEIAFANQVYHRVFNRLEKEVEVKLQMSDISFWKNDIRTVFMKQQQYLDTAAHAAKVWEAYKDTHDYKRNIGTQRSPDEQREWEEKQAERAKKREAMKKVKEIKEFKKIRKEQLKERKLKKEAQGEEEKRTNPLYKIDDSDSSSENEDVFLVNNKKITELSGSKPISLPAIKSKSSPRNTEREYSPIKNNNAYYKNIKDKIVERNLQQELG